MTTPCDLLLIGPVNDAVLADLLGLEDDSAPPSAMVMEHLRASLADCLAELEADGLAPSRLADLGHRLKGSAATFALPGQDVSFLLAALRRETALALETLRHRLDR